MLMFWEMWLWSLILKTDSAAPTDLYLKNFAELQTLAAKGCKKTNKWQFVIKKRDHSLTLSCRGLCLAIELDQWNWIYWRVMTQTGGKQEEDVLECLNQSRGLCSAVVFPGLIVSQHYSAALLPLPFTFLSRVGIVLSCMKAFICKLSLCLQ